MDLRPGRVLERNPITMWYVKYCISTMTDDNEAGGASTESRTLQNEQVSKIKIQTRNL